MALKAADDDVLLSNKTKTSSSLAVKNYKKHNSSTTNIDDSTASNSTAITTITTSSSGTSLSEWATEIAAAEDSNSSNNAPVNVKATATATATNISDGTSSTIIQKQIVEEETKEGEVVTISVEKRKKNVIFSGIKIREYKRSIGDNPTCICGPPLGLDWSYIDVQFDKYNDNFDSTDNDNSSENRSSDLIPLDEYEKFRFTGYQKRRSREKQYQNEKKLLLEKHLKQKQNQERRRNSTGGGGKQLQRCSTGGMSSSSTTQKEQIKQIKMKFLKLQPISSYKREQIILMETNCTKQDIINTTKKMKVIHNQRQSTTALLEIGLGDDNNFILPFIAYIQRKIRRYKSGISKQREQELLWENASSTKNAYNASNASYTKNAPRRSSMSTTTTARASSSLLLSSSLSSSSSGSSIHSTDSTTNTSTNTNTNTIKQYSSNRRISSAS